MPGIQRDGTQFASKSYIDGQWCRFYMGRPRKIGGYKLIDYGNDEIIRTLFVVSNPDKIDAYLGRASSLNYNTFDISGNSAGEVDRTPAGLISDPNNIWNFDLFTNKIVADASNAFIVAACIPNGGDISNETPGNIYYGDINLSTPLIQIMDDNSPDPLQVTGGIIFSSPVMIAYGDNGLIRWSDTVSGNITSWPRTNSTDITNTKIIQAYRYRSSTAPQLLMWTLSSLFNVTYTKVEGIPTFVGVPIQDNITVISPNSIVECPNQQFYWVGTNQFYFFNGIVNELENTMSTDWFFNNLNRAQTTKIFGTYVERYKEIWWYYPRGDSTECNAVIIYNTTSKEWYDSVSSRASGIAAGSILPYPLFSDNQFTTISTRAGVISSYALWMHEFGVDQVVGPNVTAIDSYFETHIDALFRDNPELNRLMRSRRIETDFVQTGDMTVTVNNRMFPSDTLENGRLIQSGPYTFNNNTQKVDDVTSQGRLVSYVFRSNVVSGNYQAGDILLDYEIGDVNP